MPTLPRFRLATLSLLALAPTLALAPLGCASGTAASSATPDLAQTGRQSDVISAKELSDVALTDKTVLDAIQRLRPRFLTSRSSTVREGSLPIRVSLDGANPEDVDALAHIYVAEVSEIRYLNVGDATLRFGMGGTSGPVILVTTKHR